LLKYVKLSTISKIVQELIGHWYNCMFS